MANIPRPPVHRRIWPPGYSVTQLTWTDPGLAVRSIAPTTPEMRLRDWPNPRLINFATSLRTWSDVGLALRSVVAVLPEMRMFDWPNPRGPGFAMSLRAFDVNLLQTTLNPGDTTVYRLRAQAIF